MPQMKMRDVKVGEAIMYNGEVWTIFDRHEQMRGNLRTFWQIKLKHLMRGNVVEQRFSPEDNVEKIHLNREEWEYLYRDGDTFVVMHPESYEQVHLPTKLIPEDQQKYTGHMLDRPRHTQQVDYFLYEHDLRTRELPEGAARADLVAAAPPDDRCAIRAETSSCRSVTFDSSGTPCDAWYFRASDDRLANDRGRPIVVMAHGLGGTKDSTSVSTRKGATLMPASAVS